jgi:hypothetical protein
MMKGQARWSGLVMGFDTHMIAGAVPALRPARPTQPNITNRSNPHYDETLDLPAPWEPYRCRPPGSWRHSTSRGLQIPPAKRPR